MSRASPMNISEQDGSEYFQRADVAIRNVLAEKNQGEGFFKSQRLKQRKSLGRRVSFAPDAHLETTHLYPQEKLQEQGPDGKIGSLLSKELIDKVNEIPSWGDVSSSPMQSRGENEDSPKGSTMDFTGSTVKALRSSLEGLIRDPAYNSHRQENYSTTTGEVTKGVPTLAELLQSDTDTELLNLPTSPKLVNITESIPTLGSLLEDDDETQPAQGPAGGTASNSETGNRQKISPLEAQDKAADDLQDTYSREESNTAAAQGIDDNGSNQINKWGFAPGEDDTQDLNMERKGRAFMGDTTFNHIFGGTETAMGMQPTQGSPTLSPADLDGLFKRANKATDVLRSVIKARIESPGSIRRRGSIDSGSRLTGRSSLDKGINHPLAGARQQPQAQEKLLDERRLSGAFSQRSTIAQKLEQPRESPARLIFTPEAVTPTSRLGPTGVPSSIPAAARSLQGRVEGRDLLTGSPANGRAWAVPGRFAETPATGLNSVEKPMIDMATPQGERQRSSPPQERKRLTDVFDSPPAIKKSRLSVVSNANETGSLLDEGDNTDSLLNADEDDGLGDVVPGSALKCHIGQTGRDLTTKLLLDDSSDFNPTGYMQAYQRGNAADNFKAFAVASGVTRSPKTRSTPILTNTQGDKSMMTTKLLAESSEEAFPQPSSALSARPNASPNGAGLGSPWPAVSIQNQASPPLLDLGNSPQLAVGHLGGLLEDETIDGLELPPEPSAGWEERYKSGKRIDQPSPTPSIFPGGALLQRTPLGPKQQSVQRSPLPVRRIEPSSATGSDSPVLPVESHRLSELRENIQTENVAATPLSSGQQQSGSPLLAGWRTDATTPKPPLAPKTTSANKVTTQSAAKPGRPATPASVGAQRGLHRLARTPIRASLAISHLTFQDFLREVDIQFLDHMRRGASINLADLASDPPPHSLQDCYRLMCLTAPEIAQYDDGIQTLNSETAARKATARAKEEELLEQDLPIFHQIQIANADDHEAIKCGAQALKKLCRLKTNLSWKEWRAEMEAHRGSSLQSKLHLLQHDLDFLQSNLSYLTELGKRVDQYANQARATAAEQLAAYTAEVTRRQRVIALRDSLTNNKLLNELRFERSTALGDQVSDLRARRAVLSSERSHLQGRLGQLQAEVEASHQAMAAIESRKLSGETLLSKIYLMDILSGCVGFHLEAERSSCQSGHFSLRYGSLFRQNIVIDNPRQAVESPVRHAAARGYLVMTSAGESLYTNLLDGLPVVSGTCCTTQISMEVPINLAEHVQELLKCKRSLQKYAGAVEDRAGIAVEDRAGIAVDAHAFAAQLAQDPALAGSGILDEFNLPQATAQSMQALLLGMRIRLGRIGDLLAELDSLPLKFPNLSHLGLRSDGSIRLSMLDLESETKFVVLLKDGLDGRDAFQICRARVYFPGPHDLTAAGICSMLRSLGPGFRQVTAACTLLSALARGDIQPVSPVGEMQNSDNLLEASALEESYALIEIGDSVSVEAQGEATNRCTQGPPRSGLKTLDREQLHTDIQAGTTPVPISDKEAALNVFSNPLYSAKRPI